MKIDYIVKNVENAMGTVCTITEKYFESVEDAIEYHKKQKDSKLSWWMITVDYEY